MTHQYTYELVKTQKINSDIIALTLGPQNPNQYLDHRAGQYVISSINHLTFPLSIANAPNDKHQLVFHLRHNQTQPQSQDFLKQLQKHNALQLEGPHGKMVSDNMPSNAQLVLLAGGTGIAPFIALLESLVATADARLNRIALFWGVRKTEDLYVKDWLKQIKKHYPNFHYEPILSELKSSPEWAGATGWVYEQALKTLKTLDKPTRVFASGPYEMVANSQKTFLTAGLKPKDFISDMMI